MLITRPLDGSFYALSVSSRPLVQRYSHLLIAGIPLVRRFCPTFPRSRHLLVSNEATAVKGAWSRAEGVHRSEAETLDGRGSGVARLAVGEGDRFVCLIRAEDVGLGTRGTCRIETVGSVALERWRVSTTLAGVLVFFGVLGVPELQIGFFLKIQ